MHEILSEIFGCFETQPLRNLSILVVDYLLELPPIKSPQIFEAYNNVYGDFAAIILIGSNDRSNEAKRASHFHRPSQ